MVLKARGPTDKQQNKEEEAMKKGKNGAEATNNQLYSFLRQEYPTHSSLVFCCFVYLSLLDEMSPPASSKVPVRVHERMTASSSSSCIHRVVYIPIQPKESSAFSSSSSASAADDKNTSIEKCKLLKKKNKGGSDSTLASSNSISTDLQQGAVKVNKLPSF